jgi:outer membrane protein OmpA-like peptidoglycan-associated protein
MPAQDRLAYVSHGSLYTVHTDGSAAVQVYARPDLTLWFPSAAPAGDNFLCWASRADGSQNVARIEADGSQLVLLTSFNQHPRSEMKSLRLGNVPVYSHKGDRIAFSFNGDIWIMDADGTNLTTLVADHHSWSPCWSPDDRRLTYVNGNFGHTNVWVTNIEDRDTYQVTDLQDAWAGRPRFGLNGKTIFFVRSQKESDQVASVPAEVSEPLADSTPITKGDHFMGLEFAPDLMKLVYVGSDDGDSWDLYMADMDGSRPQRLTHNGTVQSPAWLHPTASVAPSVAKPQAQIALPRKETVTAAPSLAAALPPASQAKVKTRSASPTAAALPRTPTAKASAKQPALLPTPPAAPAHAKAAPLKISVAVHFAKGGEHIDESSLPTLAKLAARVKQYAGDLIRVQGPLDTSALDPRYASATDRSLARAQAVRNWLCTKSGIPPTGIDALPYTPPVLGQLDQGSGLKVIIQLK